jgi:hypothetical protein
LQALFFIPLNIFMRKRKDLEQDPDQHLWLMDPDPEGFKTCGSGSGSGSPTRTYSALNLLIWDPTPRMPS